MKRYKLNKKRFARFLSKACVAGIISLSVWLTTDIIRFPECYLSTWRYQLQNDLLAGDEQANNYYQNTYIANGRELF